MKPVRVLLFIGIIFILSACSMASLKRTGYETLQNAQAQQCQKDLNSECPKRESYEAYQEKIKGFETTHY